MAEERDLFPFRRGWPWRRSLTARILAVNIIALALLAGSLFYIDNYRRELFAERFKLATAEAQIAAAGLDDTNPKDVPARLVRIAAERQMRLRLYSADGKLIADSFQLTKPTYSFIDPETEPWLQKAARTLDRGMDFLLDTPKIEAHRESMGTSAAHWPEIARARSADSTVVVSRYAPDRTPVISAATPVGKSGIMLLTTRNARDLTQNVRDARQTLVIVVGVALGISILLSLFLARTIVQPLRMLVRAAVRVRLGRDREVVVPRLPDRRDEIGLLARAISDMSAALRHRIDAVESFAADVSHELKNPLTSLRSAIESLERVENPELRAQLLSIARHDVDRIGWLITEIADASRIDAELSRTDFVTLDMLALIRALVAERESRGVNGDTPIRITRHGDAPLLVAGDAPRLERVLHNLLDNAVSFSPPGKRIDIDLTGTPSQLEIAISDHGPGIPASAREQVFERFHSLRPADEEFGSHSGLGLAIARTIVEAHFGTIKVTPRIDGQCGARLVITLPAARSK